MKRWILALLLVFSAAQLPAATPFPEAVSTSTTTLTLQPTVGVYTFTGSSPATWTLPAVSQNQDRQIIIKNRGSATITVQRAGSDNLYTTTTATSTTVTAGDWIKLINDGTYWVVNAPGSGGSGAPTDATYITQTANGTLSAEQALGSLSTGLLKNTTTTGVLSIASNSTDYVAPGATATGNITTAGNLAVTAGSDRQFIVDRTLTSDYARYMFKSGGTEMWAMGLRGDNGGSGVNNTLSLTGNAGDSYPNIFNVVPGGANYTVKWFNVTGNPSVLWDANGAAVFNEQGNAQNFRVESDTNANMLFVDGTNNRVGIGLNNPSATLEVSGTIKATSVAGCTFVRHIEMPVLNPADATTYYAGSFYGKSWATTAALRRLNIPSNCTLTKAYVQFFVDSGAGTTETSTVYVRVNNTTDTTITSGVNLSAFNLVQYSNTGLSIALSAGDYIEIKWITPTWVTNPTGVYFHATLEFVAN